jgi:DNA-binding MarR family transcriptional regulator
LETSPDSDQRDLILLEEIEQNPDTTQADLATRLGVAVGTVNWHIKRLITKGYIKVRRAERRKLRYIITPEGISLRAHLTIDYIQTSFQMYRQIRQRVIVLLAEIRQAGYDRVHLVDLQSPQGGSGRGDGDVADICRLTCLEQGVKVIDPPGNPVKEGAEDHFPVLEVKGVKVSLKMERTHARD